MINKIKTYFQQLNRPRRLLGWLFVQIWVWPQFFFTSMPMSIGLPLFLTTAACICINVIKLIVAVEENGGWDNE